MAKPWRRLKKNVGKQVSQLDPFNSGGQLNQVINNTGKNISNQLSQLDPFNDDGFINDSINNPRNIVPTIGNSLGDTRQLVTGDLAQLDPFNEGGATNSTLKDFGRLFTDPFSELDPFNEGGATNESLDELGQNIKDETGIQSLDQVSDGLGADGLGDALDSFTGGNRNTIVQEPWKEQIPYLKDLFSRANDLYTQGAPLIPGQSDYTQAANQQGFNFAQNNPNVGLMRNSISDLAGYKNPYLQDINGLGYDNPSMGAYQQMMGYKDPSMSGFNDLAGYRNNAGDNLPGIMKRAADNPFTGMAINAANKANPGTSYLSSLQGNLTDTQSRNMLTGTAQGDYLGGNPYLQNVMDRAGDNVNKAFERNLGSINKYLSSRGRLGSPLQKEMFQDALQTDVLDTVAGMNERMLAGNYDQERGRQLQSIGMMGDLYGQGAGRNLQLGSQLGSQYGTDLDRVIGAAGLGSNNYNTGTNQMFTGTGMMSDINNSNFANRINALQGLSGASNTGFQNRFNATQGLGDTYNTGQNFMLNRGNTLAGYGDTGANMRMSATGMIPSLNSMQMDNFGLMSSIGNNADAYNRSTAMEPWDRLSMYQNAVSGGFGGTETGPGKSRLEQLSDIAGIAAPFF